MSKEENPSGRKERYFQEIPSKPKLIILCSIVALFGALLMTTGFARALKGPRPDSVFMLLMGVGILALIWRFWKVTTGPRLVLSPGEIILQTFFRKQRWQTNEIASIASFPTIVYPRAPGGRALEPLKMHYLGIKTKRGNVSKFALPCFEGNEQLLSSLAERTNLTIEDIEDDAAFDKWRNSG